jgi:anthranilate synthase component 1
MIEPSFGAFKKLAKRGNLIALRIEIPSDLETPVSAFLKFEAGEPCAFLLESAEQGERTGRYSFLGFEPDTVLISRGKRNFLRRGARLVRLPGKEDLLGVMQKTLAAYRLANPEGLPGFAGGYVGFLGYENVRFFEHVVLRDKEGLGVEDGIFFFVKDFLLFDHFRKTLSLVSLCEVKERGLVALWKSYREAVARLERRERALRKGLSERISVRPYSGKPRFDSNLTRGEFEKKVERIKAYIRAGDCIQVVLSQRFSLGKVERDFEIYRALRSINPSPYMFYFRCGALRLIGSSPEVLVKKEGRRAEVRPIAGTRPRGATPEEDAKLEESLRASKKEMAEHLMLVDLGRNDLGRVCEFQSVRVTDFAWVERYSHVMHLVSSVTGRLKRGKGAFDLLRATFPAGTVTGAPKIRAMEIIDELEPEKRGPYAGCLGYFSFNQEMDMCITIRTIVVQGGRAYVQAGAGIVYDSKPSREYEETLNKARALFHSVKGREGGL